MAKHHIELNEPEEVHIHNHRRKKGGKIKEGMRADGGRMPPRLDRGGRPRREKGGQVVETAGRRVYADGGATELADGGRGEKWIQTTGVDKPGHKGRLHRALGVPEGQKIPAKKIERAAHSGNSHLRHMAQFAKNVPHASGGRAECEEE